jgi:hypothetical protein
MFDLVDRMLWCMHTTKPVHTLTRIVLFAKKILLYYVQLPLHFLSTCFFFGTEMRVCQFGAENCDAVRSRQSRAANRWRRVWSLGRIVLLGGDHRSSKSVFASCSRCPLRFKYCEEKQGATLHAAVEMYRNLSTRNIHYSGRNLCPWRETIHSPYPNNRTSARRKNSLSKKMSYKHVIPSPM